MNTVNNRVTFSVISPLLSILLVAQTANANPICGNNVTEPTEQCDLGNADGTPGSGCSSTCQVVAICGNNIAEGTEQCDDNKLPLAVCTSACKLVIPSKCGNNVVDPGEECEPSLLPSSCNADCTFTSCGDGKLSPNSGEECDAHGQAATCNTNCKYSVCGDQIINKASGEECDPGTQTAACNWNCKFSLCGDGIVNQQAGEECDNGAANSLSGPCLPTCKFLVTTTTTAATNQSNTQGPTSSGGGSDTLNYVGVIAGTVVGVLALVAAIIPVAWQCRKHHNKMKARRAASTTSQNIPMTSVGNPNPAFGATLPGSTPTNPPAPTGPKTAAPVPPLNVGGVGPSTKPAKALPPTPVTPTGKGGATTPTGSTTPKTTK